MSVDPVQPPAPDDPTPPKSPAESAGDNVEALRQKRRFKRGGGEVEEGEKPDQAIEVLSSLLQDLVAKKEQRPAPPEPAAPPPKAAKYHRLSKSGSGNPTAAVEASPAPAEIPPSSSPPPPNTPPVAPAVAFRPAPTADFDQEHRRLRVWKTLFVFSLLILTGMAGYVLWFMRPAREPLGPTAKSAPTSGWTDASLQQLDQALAADQAGDLKDAQRLASAITPPDVVPPPGLTIYLASLGTRQDRHFDAEADLLRLAKDAPPAELAAIDAGLGFNFTRTRDFEKAADIYKNAVRYNPFSASLLYREGEAARHLGHLPDAEASFRRALDRVPTGQPEMASLRECIGLKLRLCYVEQGQESEFQSELDEQLKALSPSGYWLLTAAAVALQHKDMASAAGLLGRARTALGEEQFDALLNDYLFRAQADRKELAEFFPDAAARRAKLQPTMAHTVEP